MEFRLHYIVVEDREVYNRSPTSCGLGDHKHTAVIAWLESCRLYSSLHQKSLNLSLQGLPLDGQRGVRLVSDGCLRQGRPYMKGNHVPRPQDLHHPRVDIPVPPGLPREGQAATYTRARGWLLFGKTPTSRRPTPSTWRLSIGSL